MFHYIYSCDLTTINLEIKIGSLEGYNGPDYSPQEYIRDPMLKFSGADPIITAQIFANERPMGVAKETRRKCFSANQYAWNEWLTLPIKFSDLPREAQLCITVWDVYGCDGRKPIGGTTIPLFKKTMEYRSGLYDLRIWPHKIADGSAIKNTTPAKLRDKNKIEEAELYRLIKLRKKYRNGHMARVDWQDRLALKELEVRIDEAKRRSKFHYLDVEFQRFVFENRDYHVVYYEPDADEVYRMAIYPELVSCPDPEIGRPNLVEEKHHLLTRGAQSGLADRELKPNAEQRNHLNRIVDYPPTRPLAAEDKDLLWKFRFHLSGQSRALAKFLRCVDWQLPHEAQQAVELMAVWSPMDALDALELLSPDFRGIAPVRKYAVQRLRSAEDEDLILCLLQLVQALRYEDFQEIFVPKAHQQSLMLPSNTESSLIASRRLSRFDSTLSTTTIDSSLQNDVRLNHANSTTSDIGYNIEDLLAKAVAEDLPLADQEDLASFLISRALSNTRLGTYFFWFLTLESAERQEASASQREVQQMYQTVLRRYSESLKGGNLDHRLFRSQLNTQATLLFELDKVMQMVTASGGNRKQKVETLRRLLKDGRSESSSMRFTRFDPVPFPMDPSFNICGIDINDATIFKSALMPCKLTFVIDDNSETRYSAIFKHGDDLRQDQLVLQMFQISDRILRQENLDLKLTPYKVLATSTKHGLVQFVESSTVASILATHSTLQNYLRKHAPSKTGPYGIQKDVLDAYVRSCAGYCIITFILGVGDRHLDNLLLTKDGRLFHVDFGYILGRDPKPMPPPMRLSKEMVECMGGLHSEHFAEFKSYCYNAFIQLRRKAGLFLNLFSLMVDTNIPDIALEPDKAVKKVRDRFFLDMSDEESVAMVKSVLDLSVHAFMPVMMDRLHTFAQLLR